MPDTLPLSLAPAADPHPAGSAAPHPAPHPAPEAAVDLLRRHAGARTATSLAPGHPRLSAVPVLLPAGARPALLVGVWTTSLFRPDRIWLTNLPPAWRAQALAVIGSATAARVGVAEAELGLHDFAGRSYPGWHRHATSYLGEGAAAVCGGLVVARLLGRFGGVRVLTAGLLIQGVGTVAMFALPQNVNLPVLLVTSSVMGLGHVFSVVSFITVMTSGVSEEDQGVVGGLSQLPQYVAAIGVSGLSAIAAARTNALASGAAPSHADTLGGLHAGMVTAGVVALAGALLVGAVLRKRTTA